MKLKDLIGWLVCVLVIIAVTAIVLNAGQGQKRTWTYECFAFFGSAVAHLNNLPDVEANNAKIVGYDHATLSHCVVYRK